MIAKTIPLALLIVSIKAFGAVESKKVLVDIDFELKEKGRSAAVKTQVIFDDSYQWKTIGGTKEGVTLLAKRLASEPKSFEMEFIVLDGKRAPETVVFSAPIGTAIGDPARLTLNEAPPGKSRMVLFIRPSKVAAP